MNGSGGDYKLCGRCGHSWSSVVDMPARCPSCGTYHWNEKVSTNTCALCGHSWFSRTAKAPTRCPSCKTRSWESGIRRNRSDRTRMLKVDERSKGIMDMYMSGVGCVRISMDMDVPLSIVVDTVKACVTDKRSPRM